MPAPVAQLDLSRRRCPTFCKRQTAVPMVVRLLGTNSAEGRQILAEANMETAVTLMEAAGKAVAAAKRVEAAG